jgi:hypothetical protein
LQFKVASQRSAPKADVVVDLLTTVRPGTTAYPFNATRDALQDPARWAFRDLVDEVERGNESVGHDEEYEVFDPDSDDADERWSAAVCPACGVEHPRCAIAGRCTMPYRSHSMRTA